MLMGLYDEDDDDVKNGRVIRSLYYWLVENESSKLFIIIKYFNFQN